MSPNLLYLVLGGAVVLLAVLLAVVLFRLNRALAAVEDLIVMSTAEMRETLPEVRHALVTVNHIAEGVNVGLYKAGSGLERGERELERRWRRARLNVRAGWFGVRVGLARLVSSWSELESEVHPRDRQGPVRRGGLNLGQPGNQEE